MIICIVGPSCAGKTTSAKYIQDKTGGDHYEASEFVRKRYSNSSFDGIVMDFVKREFNNKGMETFAHPICDQIKKADGDIAIISGFRTNEEIKTIREEFKQVFVSSVYANSLLRYQRKLKRDNPESEYSYRDFINKDITEYNFGIIRSLGEQSDSLIINERSFDHLYQNIDDRILSRISISH